MVTQKFRKNVYWNFKNMLQLGFMVKKSTLDSWKKLSNVSNWAESEMKYNVEPLPVFGTGARVDAAFNERERTWWQDETYEFPGV